MSCPRRRGNDAVDESGGCLLLRVKVAMMVCRNVDEWWRLLLHVMNVMNEASPLVCGTAWT